MPLCLPLKPRQYVQRRQEVDGFDLNTVGRAPTVPAPNLPAVVPWIDGRSCLAGGIDLPIIAVPLRRLFSSKTGQMIPRTRADLTARFAVNLKTRILVTGV